jgi:hypothetical protein
MGNKEVKKVVLNKERLMSSLQNKDLSLRSLDGDPNFKYSTKTIGRALNSGLISVTVMDELAKYLSVSSEYLSGINPLSLNIYKFNILTNNHPMSRSVICTNEIEANAIIHNELTKTLMIECFTIKLIDILPIINGTII